MSTSGPSWWLDQIGRFPLLTPAQELTYGRQIQEWQAHPEGPIQCPPDVRRRGLRARERFIRSNLRLVVTIAKRFRRLAPTEAFDDLIQAGNHGLIEAVERFDPSRGYRFSTYAAYWIQMRVTTHLERSERSIRLPTTISPKAAAIPRTIRKLFARLGREPSRYDVANELGMTVDELDRIATVGRQCASLDARISDEDGLTTLGQIIASPEILPLPDTVQLLEHHLNKLPQRSRLVLQAAYGIGRGTAKIAEIAKELGITRAATKALLDQAVLSLKAEMNPEIKQLPLTTLSATIEDEPAWLIKIRHQLGPIQSRKRRQREELPQLSLALHCPLLTEPVQATHVPRRNGKGRVHG